MSPALRWPVEAFTKELEQEPGGLLGTRVWIDMGTSESYSASSETTRVQNEKLIGAAKRLEAALTKHRIEHRLVIDDQHSTHNETAWASRFPQAIMYTLRE
jgi:predicted alpha/beta superfamily hydrolase